MPMKYLAPLTFLAVFAVGVLAITGFEYNDGYSCPENVQSCDAVVNEDALPTSQDLPRGTTVIMNNPKSKGWSCTGTFPCDRMESENLIMALMEEKGFVLKRKVDKGVDSPCCLILFERGQDLKVMWMIWQNGSSHTGFSWGKFK